MCTGVCAHTQRGKRRRKQKMLCALINYNNNDAKHDNNMPDRWQWTSVRATAGWGSRLLLIIAIFCALSRRKSSQTYAAGKERRSGFHGQNCVLASLLSI
ncbi:uncharacterized protein Dvir_GJ26903 [Drosophila virilis]|uniref:Uncharacterized protein n=1 Tax=Drosophila virilis TaxID=7244 RepID=A0A0Q9WB68_DROVI|nr:uncharacterized protein Dvir_GJ26903 [Drosophila virilis]